MTGSGIRLAIVGRQQYPHRSHVTGFDRAIPSSAGQTGGPVIGDGWQRRRRIRNTRSVPVGGLSSGVVISHATRTRGGTAVGKPVSRSAENHTRQFGNSAIWSRTALMGRTRHDRL